MTEYGQPTGWTAVRTDALNALIDHADIPPIHEFLIDDLKRVENVWRWTQNILTPGQHRTDNT